MKLEKINLIITGILILLIFFFFFLGNGEVTTDENSSNQINRLEERISVLENIFNDEESGKVINTIKINKKEVLECALISKENAANSKLILYNYANKNLLEVENVAIDGYEYLKSLGESKHNLYIGIQCKQENGWILMNSDSNKYFVKKIEGDLVVVKDEFIQENGYFSLRGDVQVLCCRII